jgi:hypothetical protein
MRVQRYVHADPGVPWGRLLGAMVALGIGYLAVRNYPQAVRYLRMRAM